MTGKTENTPPLFVAFLLGVLVARRR